MRFSVALIAVFCLALLVPAAASGSPGYRFQVDRNISHIYVNKDGSIDIEYYITFRNMGDPIDIVDIGLPHTGYSLRTATADIDGYVLTDIRRSTEVGIGVEVHLGRHAIPSGQTGVFHFRINNPKMVFPDTEDPEYASVQFAPTYFGSRFTVGSTYLEVNVHFPVGVTGRESKWHYVQYTRDSQVDGRLVFTWVNESASQKKYGVGVSFPRKYVDEVFDSSEVSFKPGSSFNWGNILEWLPFIIFGLVVIIGIIGGTVAKRQKRMRYLAPEARIEGLGVRKDLDPVEAAVVMELPLSRIMVLILMRLIRKGCVEVLQVHPLRVNVLRKDGSDLTRYEKSVLKAFKPSKSASEKTRERRLTNAVVHLIEDVRDKLKKGYSRKATAEYYRGKVDYMWEQLERDPQVQHLAWLALDEDCSKKVSEAPARRKKVERLWEDNYGGYFRYHQYHRNPYLWMDDIEDDVVPDNSRFTHGVSKSTNPTAWITSSGWSSGGGGGGFSCACACAGCACACAGGGR